MRQRQRRGRTGRDTELLVAMLRYASLISRPMRDGVADPAGLSPNELRILIALSGEGESAGQDLAELMGMHAMTVSRALGSLRRMGLVERVRDARNRRRRPYRLSARGRTARRALEPNLARVGRFLLAALSARERAVLGGMLEKLYRQVTAWHPVHTRPHVPRA